MKRIASILLALALVFSVVGVASATSFTLASMNVSLNTADPGLTLYWTQVAVTPTTFALNNVGDSVTANLFTIGTTETTVNLFEDTTPKPISASFYFSDPFVTATDSGTTRGVFLTDRGSVLWNDPVYFAFGTTGLFSINLSDVSFGTPGSATVSGTMTLARADTAPVPEPATMLLMGSGLAAMAVVRRLRSRK